MVHIQKTSYPEKDKKEERLKELDLLWQQFKHQDSHEARNQLLERYLPIVRCIAQQLQERLPNWIDLNDLLAAGFFGLLDAVNHYDPSKGIKFETFCTLRIRGSMIDELRRMDWIPRLTRLRAHHLEETHQRLERKLKRAPKEEEMARAVGVDLAEYHRILEDVQRANIVSQGPKHIETGGEEMEMVDLFVDEHSADPIKEMMKEELFHYVKKNLNEIELLVLQLFYYEDFSFTDIGKVLNLTESRISQIHGGLILKLRSKIAGFYRSSMEE